jgi:phosphoribosyl 1,2-cyclic phosphate phosphodiesterase
MSKNNQIKIKFLGTAANGGVPQIDCRCKNCVLNQSVRKRSCILIEANQKKIIIDCGPDFHSQIIENNLRLQDISAVVISHLHWDHCSGIFEVSSGKVLKISVCVSKKLSQVFRSEKFFNFIFKYGWAKLSKPKLPKINFIEIEHHPDFPTFAISMSNGSKRVLIATDIWKLNDKFISQAKRSDLIIFDSTFLNKSKHWHMSVKKSAPILAMLNPNVIFTHVNHSENSDNIQKFLKKFGFKLAFDGMEIKI